MPQPSLPDYTTLPLTRRDIRDLRSDHAGEHGAVAIYIGMLSITRDPGLVRFARRHLLAETRHRRTFDRWIPDEGKSKLLPLWWLSGWLLGAGSALFGARAAYRTVAAVETFVERHYQEQIDHMKAREALVPLVDVLEQFMHDEIHHRDDAIDAVPAEESVLARAWAGVVGGGSALGVIVARRV